MVSTRSQSHHPSNPTTSSSPSPPTPPPPTPAPHHYPRTWSHTPSNLTLLWLLISLPLVFWDASYVLLRPHSMPGGFLHSPLWTPYALYGAVDYIYGWPAYEARNGFTAAQTALNVVECLLYGFYLWVVYRHGRGETGEGRGAPGSGKVGWVGRGKVVRGRWGGWAVVVGFGAAVMTVSKTVLYCGFSFSFFFFLFFFARGPRCEVGSGRVLMVCRG